MKPKNKVKPNELWSWTCIHQGWITRGLGDTYCWKGTQYPWMSMGVVAFAQFLSACKRQTPTRAVRWMRERRWGRISSADWAVSTTESVSKRMWVGVLVILQLSTSVWCRPSTMNQQRSYRCSPKWIRDGEVANRSVAEMAETKGAFKQKDAASQYTWSAGANPHFWEVFHTFCHRCAVSKEKFLSVASKITHLTVCYALTTVTTAQNIKCDFYQ